MRNRKATPQNETDVDMTPMLDIVFIMLIFFIVTTSFVKENGINIHRPEAADNPPPPTERPVVIKINDLEDIHFAGRLIQQGSVQSNVEMALSKNPNAVIIVQVADKADTGVLVDVVDQVKKAGVVQVSVSKLSS